MPGETSREVARVFDSWAKQGRDEGMEDRHGLSARPVLESLELAEGDRFLDLGAGNAWAATWARAAGAQALAVDVSRRMLSRARERSPRPELVQASFEALPFADASIDVAFSMEALYYAEELERALREAARVLSPGGSLHALVDFYEGNPASENWPEETGIPMHRLSAGQWEDAFEEAGFEDVQTQRMRSEEGEGWRAEHGSLYVRGSLTVGPGGSRPHPNA